jgi:hypothetical protein
MAIYRYVRIITPSSIKDEDDVEVGTGYGCKKITIEETCSNTIAAARRIQLIKDDPKIVAKYTTSSTTNPNSSISTAKLESWSIAEKTRVYAEGKDASGNTTTVEANIVKDRVTKTSTHVVLTYTISLQDFWITA